MQYDSKNLPLNGGAHNIIEEIQILNTTEWAIFVYSCNVFITFFNQLYDLELNLILAI